MINKFQSSENINDLPGYHDAARQSNRQRQRLRVKDPFLCRGSNTREGNLRYGGIEGIYPQLLVCSEKKKQNSVKFLDNFFFKE